MSCFITTIAYDAENRKGLVDEAFGATEQRSSGVILYDKVGNVRTVKDKRNIVSETIYADTTFRSYSYDGNGNLKTETDEETIDTSYGYDRENRLTASERAGELTQKSYTPLGDLLAVIHPEGNSRLNQYDKLRRLIKVTDDPWGPALATDYEYDANNNLTKRTDARRKVVDQTYDELNRMSSRIQRKSSGDLLTSFDLYDAEGNLIDLTDPKGQKQHHTYDDLNRRTESRYTDTASTTLTVTTGYDGNNNITASSSPSDSTSNLYDNFDRLQSSTQRGTTIGYTYFDSGNRKSVTVNGNSTSYLYDDRNRVKSATAGAATTTFDYYKDGKKKTVGYPNGAKEEYEYFPTNRVQTLTNSLNSAVISKFDYNYDRNGNRLRQDETRGIRTISTGYTYDSLDRMDSYSVTEISATTRTDYTFEGYNRKTESTTKPDSSNITKTYNYDDTDWLTQINDGTKTIDYSYDNNGNTQQKTDSTDAANPTIFEYDARDKLTRTTKGATILGSYAYNAAGYRIRQNNSDRGNVDYLYDGTAVIEERNAGGLLAHYRYAGKLYSLFDGTNSQYYHQDALGSTVDLTDDAGTTKASYFLNPWGMIVDSIGNSVNRRVFTGKEIDQNTGLINIGVRYYDPETARFTTQDSYLGDQGTPPSLHRYLYAYSNPTVFIDLEGYEAFEWKNVPEKGFFDKWIFDREHAKDIYRGMVNDSPVGNYRPESARTDAAMDLIRTGLEFKVGGEVLGTVAGKLKQPAKDLLGKIIEKSPGAVKDAVKTVAKVTTELKNGAQELGQELLEESISVIKNSPVGNNIGSIGKIGKLSEKIATGKDEAFFWSGRSNGIGGERVAKEIAESHRGTTLEMLIEERGIKMPDWDPNNPKSIKAWEKISKEYAKKASGTVRAVIGEDLRPGSVWEEIELPALIKNKKVDKIITIDPATKADKIIFDRSL